jgi:NAD+ kinase
MGFLTETFLNQLPEAIEQVMADEYEVEDRVMLTVKVLRGRYGDMGGSLLK